MSYTGYWISSEHIYGPSGYTQCWISANNPVDRCQFQTLARTIKNNPAKSFRIQSAICSHSASGNGKENGREEAEDMALSDAKVWFEQKGVVKPDRN